MYLLFRSHLQEGEVSLSEAVSGYLFIIPPPHIRNNMGLFGCLLKKQVTKITNRPFMQP